MKDTLETPSTSESTNSTPCPNCSATDIRTNWVDETFPYGVGPDAVNLTARLPLRTCSKCAYEYYDEEAEDARHEAVCRHLGVQTPAEIEALRKKYSLSRAEFARLTKLGEATIARWERGALIQNTANDRYLYLLRWPENFERLRDLEEGRKVPEVSMPEAGKEPVIPLPGFLGHPASQGKPEGSP